MTSYGIPKGYSLRGAIQAVFNFYCTPVTAETDQLKKGDDMDIALDGSSFLRMVRAAPELSEATRIQRYEIDLIFSKAKAQNKRKLSFEEFLFALKELGATLYPDEDPTNAMAIMLVKHILGLFDDNSPVPDGLSALTSVKRELAVDS